jgi:hypothetical protein
MARKVLFLLSLLAIAVPAALIITVSAQNPTPNSPQKMKLNEVPRELAPVDFLAEAPVIDGVISFELLLPWQDLHPYHPCLSDGIGFNLGFVKASGQGSFYYRVLPEGLGDENTPRRYIKLRFAEPALDKGFQTFVGLERNHLSQG